MKKAVGFSAALAVLALYFAIDIGVPKDQPAQGFATDISSDGGFGPGGGSRPPYPTGNLQDLTVAQSARLGIAFPGNASAGATPVDYTIMNDIGIGTVRLNVSWQSGFNSTVSRNIQVADSLGMQIVLTFASDKSDSIKDGQGSAINGMPLDLDNWWGFVWQGVEYTDDDGSGDFHNLDSGQVDYYMILNEWTTRSNASGGWLADYWLAEEDELIAFIDTTYHAVHTANNSAKLIMGAPSGIYSDIMMLCDGVVSYEIKNDLATYTAEDCASVPTDSIKTILDMVEARSSADIYDLHQYGPLTHHSARFSYHDSLWGGVDYVSTECGGPSLNYDASPAALDYFNYAWYTNLFAFSKGQAWVLWLKLFDSGTESPGNDDVPFLVGDGATVTTYRPQWFAYKALALCFEDAATCTRLAEGVYKIVLTGGEATYMLLGGFGSSHWTVEEGAALVQAIYIIDPATGSYSLGRVPAAGDLVAHNLPVILSEATLIE